MTGKNTLDVGSEMSHAWPARVQLTAGILYQCSSPHTNREPKHTKDSKNHPKLHPNNGLCGRKEEDTVGTQQSPQWRTSLQPYKGKACHPQVLLWGITPHPSLRPILTSPH